MGFDSESGKELELQMLGGNEFQRGGVKEEDLREQEGIMMCMEIWV